MKDLLIKVKQRLTERASGVRERDIFFTPDADILPESARLPCIAIKDGKVTRMDTVGDMIELALPIEITVYVKLIKDDDAILSLLDHCATVVEALRENYFNDYVTEISVGDETPVRVFVKKDALIIRKTLFFEYSREM